MQKMPTPATKASLKMHPYWVDKKPAAPSRIAFETCFIFSSPSSFARTQPASQPAKPRPPMAIIATGYNISGNGCTGLAAEIVLEFCKAWCASISVSARSLFWRKPPPSSRSPLEVVVST